jgi:hypothetical protein
MSDVGWILVAKNKAQLWALVKQSNKPQGM